MPDTSYIPPFTMTEEITNLVIEIAELTGGKAFPREKTIAEKILELIQKDGTLSAAKMGELLGISPRQVQRILKQLKNDGRIEHVGANRNGVYRIL